MYYDSYFHSLINNTNSIISIQNSILLYLQVLVFLVSLIFVYNVKTTLPKLFGLSFFMIFLYFLVCLKLPIIYIMLTFIF